MKDYNLDHIKIKNFFSSKSTIKKLEKEKTKYKIYL